mmetsp:Transcript_85609/g.242791  ORF Transcript_85609/g.242791 Transcript_85609/m.242791 type:complete len:220 (+) Transcript_85609:61-720(+)
MASPSEALTRAAEELARAALVQSESSTLGELKSMRALMEKVAATSVTISAGIEGLGESSKTISAGIVGLGESSKSDAQTVVQGNAASMKALAEAVSKQTEAVNRQTRISSCQWAIANSGKYTFFKSRNYDDRSHQIFDEKHTETLVLHVLKTFLKGLGCFIDSYVVPTDRVSDYGNPKAEDLKVAKERFREALPKLIAEMTGQTPRVALSNGKYAIYFE